MDKQLGTQVLKALREKRDMLYTQVEEIDSVIAMFKVDIERPAVKAKPVKAQVFDKVLEVATFEWMTAEQYAKKTGLIQMVTTRTLNQLITRGTMQEQTVNGVKHYRRRNNRSTGLALVAGEGVRA